MPFEDAADFVAECERFVETCIRLGWIELFVVNGERRIRWSAEGERMIRGITKGEFVDAFLRRSAALES
jgi:hypothetical protein